MASIPEYIASRTKKDYLEGSVEYFRFDPGMDPQQPTKRKNFSDHGL